MLMLHLVITLISSFNSSTMISIVTLNSDVSFFLLSISLGHVHFYFISFVPVMQHNKDT